MLNYLLKCPVEKDLIALKCDVGFSCFQHILLYELTWPLEESGSSEMQKPTIFLVIILLGKT